MYRFRVSELIMKRRGVETQRTICISLRLHASAFRKSCLPSTPSRYIKYQFPGCTTVRKVVYCVHLVRDSDLFIRCPSKPITNCSRDLYCYCVVPPDKLHISPKALD